MNIFSENELTNDHKLYIDYRRLTMTMTTIAQNIVFRSVVRGSTFVARLPMDYQTEILKPIMKTLFENVINTNLKYFSYTIT